MKNDEFSFFNQQLAAMVRDGIPLESALRRLCADMRQSPLRSELEKLEADLAKGARYRAVGRVVQHQDERHARAFVAFGLNHGGDANAGLAENG